MSEQGEQSGTGKIHVHIENNRDLGEVFEFTREALQDAQGRNPTAAERLTVTVGYDADILEDALKTAHALIGWNFDRRGPSPRGPPATPHRRPARAHTHHP